MTIELRRPYLLFLADVAEPANAKTAFGLRDWLPDGCVGQLRLAGCAVDLGLPDLEPSAAASLGARSIVIGVAPPGGRIPPQWLPPLEQSIEAGLDVVSGMHSRLSEIPVLRDAAVRKGVTLHDVRHSDRQFPVATGRRRSGRRLLTVGTDCALGKKYTALAIARELDKLGVTAHFRATGQTGIMIAGSGIAIDAVVADFVAGAAESLSPSAAPEHWDVIEGQGSLFHPAYAGVTLGLLHGSQPDALVLCHDPMRRGLLSWPDFPVPELSRAIDRYVEAGRLTNPDVRCIGISVNTSQLSEHQALEYLQATQLQLGIPAFDPIRTGVDSLLPVLVNWQ